MQDRANVSADFLELMKQEILDVIKKYIEVDEDLIDVRLTNQLNDDGTNGAPSLYANIPIVNIKNDMMAEKIKDFEGVDFNKEIGIPTYQTKEESENEQKEENSNEIKNEETKNVEENKVQEQEATNKEEQEEVKEMFEEVDDDDDDDVTFDDLLKAAEAADKKEEIKNSEAKKGKKTKDKQKKNN